MINLYIDPAYSKPIAWAMFENGKLFSYGSCDRAGLYDLESKIIDCDQVYCEDQMIVTASDAIKKLIRSAGWVEGLCIYVGVPFELINPRSWKKYYGLNKKFGKYVKDEIRMVNLVSITGKWEADLLNVTEDQADAILMGAAWEDRLSTERQENAPLQGPDTGAKGAGSTSRKRGSTAIISGRIPRSAERSTGTKSFRG